MTEKAEKYRAISKLAELLRESTKKRLVLDDNMDPEVEYFNVIFTEEEHEDVKRAFLRLCGEV